MELKKGKIKRESGISLIVLVITIIVIALLSVSVILFVVKNNPINSAKETTKKNNDAVSADQARMIAMDWYMEELFDKSTSRNLEGKKAELKEKLIAAGFSEDIANRTQISSDRKIRTIPEEHPKIPISFEYLEGTIDTGFVIRNIVDQNEFVWVPVNSEEEYVRYHLSRNQTSYNDTTLNEQYVDVVGESQKADIVNNGGFYLARYEASKSDTIVNTRDGQYMKTYIPMSKKNQEPYVNIRGDKKGSDERCVILASNYIYRNESDCYSTLMTGYMFDITVKWLYENSSYNNLNYFTSFYSKGISSNMIGNYSDNKILTGSDDRYKINNIYDLAGNVYEWTTENDTADSNHTVCRGGSIGRLDYMANRYSRRYTSSGDEVGFRFAIVLKSQ